MTIAFIKHDLGNKQFVIEWIIDPTVGTQEGDKFEAKDCRLISIHALSANDVVCKLMATLYSIPDDGHFSIDIPGQTLIPYYNTPQQMIPAMRFYWPYVEEKSGVTFTSKICLLFEAI